MSEGIEAGETRIEPKLIKYWNSKKAPATKGDQVRGILLRCEAAGKFEGEQYVLKGTEGEIYLPNHTVLNGMMQQVKVGRTVRVVYLGKGEATRGRNAPELYDVFMTADPIQEVPKAIPEPPKASQSEEMKALISQLEFASKVYPDGIPDSIFQEICKHDTTKIHILRAEGRVFEPKAGFWKVRLIE